MKRPFANVERDTSIKAWEVSIGIDDSEYDAVQIFFFDDGRTEVKRYTAAELSEMLLNDLSEAIVEGAAKLKLGRKNKNELA